MRGRFWQTLIAVLILAAQGFFDLSPVIAVALAHSPAVWTEEEKQAVAVCKCIHCKTGKNCCCQTAESPADAIVLRAVCDTPQDAIHQRVLIPRALPPVIELPLALDAISQPTPAFLVLSLADGRTPTPPTHPPCFG